MDDNCWEILSNPRGGYSWLFERGDQDGKGHQARDYDRARYVKMTNATKRARPNPAGDDSDY